jgi:hypothetical protein
MVMQTPKLNMDPLSSGAHEWAQQIIATRGKNKGRLRASSPSKQYDDLYYVWRNVAFYLSPIAQHQCMPVCTDFCFKLRDEVGQARRKQLDKIIDEIVDAVPLEERHGLNKWGKALGYF